MPKIWFTWEPTLNRAECVGAVDFFDIDPINFALIDSPAYAASQLMLPTSATWLSK